MQRVHGMASGRSRYRGVPLVDQPREPALDRRLGQRFKEYCSRFGLSFRDPDLPGKHATVS
jgi:hypothetical protein